MSKAIGRPNRVLDDWNMRLRADPVGDSDKRPMLFFDFGLNYVDEKGHWSFRDFYIGINLLNGAKNARQKFPIPPSEFTVFTTAIEACAMSRKPVMFKMPFLNYTWFGGKRSEKLETEATLVVARDDNGIFIGFTTRGIEPVKFYISPTDRYPTLYEGNEALTIHDTASLYAMAYSKAWSEASWHLFNNHWMDDDDVEKAKEIRKKANAKRFAESQKGGNNNYSPKENKNPWQGDSASASSGGGFDDELPWD